MENPFDKTNTQPMSPASDSIDTVLTNDENSVFDVPDMLKSDSTKTSNPFENPATSESNNVAWNNAESQQNNTTTAFAKEAKQIADDPNMVQSSVNTIVQPVQPVQPVQAVQQPVNTIEQAVQQQPVHEQVIQQQPLQDQNIQNRPTGFEQGPVNTTFQNGNKQQQLPNPNNNNNNNTTIIDTPQKLNNILSLYILINPKLFSGAQIANNEADLIDISFNVEFGNLRISLYKSTPATFGRTSVDITAADKMSTIHLYLEGRENLIHVHNQGKGVFHNIERVFNFNNKQTNNWIPDKSTFTMDSDDSILLETTNVSTNYNIQYNFTDWQLRVLLKICLDLSNSDFINSRIMRLTKH